MKIGIIGYGSMGKMLLEKFCQNEAIKPFDLLVSNRNKQKISHLTNTCTVCENNKQLALEADVIFLCVRPTDLKNVLTEISNDVKKNALLISLNGSVTFKQLEMLYKNKLIKAIPSVTAEVNKSQTLMCCNELVTNADKEYLKELLECFGSVIELPENEMGMGSELVSCMPGFIAALFNEICISASKHTQIPENEIISMVLNTMTATSELMIKNNCSFDEIVSRVATKGGITEVGTQIIKDRFPSIADAIFEETLKKRKQTAMATQKSFEE